MDQEIEPLETARAKALQLDDAAFAEAAAVALTTGPAGALRIYSARIPEWDNDLEALADMYLLQRVTVQDLKRISCSALATTDYARLFNIFPRGHVLRPMQDSIFRHLRCYQDPPGSGEPDDGKCDDT